MTRTKAELDHAIDVIEGLIGAANLIKDNECLMNAAAMRSVLKWAMGDEGGTNFGSLINRFDELEAANRRAMAN